MEACVQLQCVTKRQAIQMELFAQRYS